MNDPVNTPMLPPPSGVSGWIPVWREAVTRPSDQTFARIALAPGAKLTTALLWVFLGSLVNFFLGSLVQGAMINQLIQSYNPGFEGMPAASGGLMTVICGAPIGAVVSVVLFVIVVGIVQLLARMFGGRGTFDQMAYAFAAILAPIYLVSGVLTLLAAIPYVGLCFGILGMALGLYVLVLQVMAVKGVNQFGWGQAIASLLLPVLVLTCCLSLGVFGLLRAMGPQITDIFNSLTPPSP